MELREKYKNINLEELLIDNLRNGILAQTDQELSQENIEKIDKSLKLIKEKNWERTYIVLYYLLDAMNKEKKLLKIKSIEEGVIDTIYHMSSVILIALSVNKKGYKHINIKIGRKLNEINVKNVSINSIIIEVSSEEEKRNIIEKLNNICTEWEDIFIIANEENDGYKGIIRMR